MISCRNPLLGNDEETNNETTPTARQQIFNKQQLNYNRGTVFLRGLCRDVINRTIGAVNQLRLVLASGQRHENRS
jgi:hypothetical protein